MNATFIGIMNGIAIAAANAKDTNTVSVLQTMMQDMSLIGTAYDGAATSTTVFLNPALTPASGQLLDSNAKVAAQLGLSGKLLGA